MSVAKVIEILSEGNTIEQAVENAVAEAGKSVRNIQHVYVNEMQAIVDGGKVKTYRVNCKVTFVVGSEG
jgi:flavin-binding protein dodecin